jgi:hypothetical protein
MRMRRQREELKERVLVLGDDNVLHTKTHRIGHVVAALHIFVFGVGDIGHAMIL